MLSFREPRGCHCRNVGIVASAARKSKRPRGAKLLNREFGHTMMAEEDAETVEWEIAVMTEADAGAARDDEDALDLRVRQMTGCELSPRAAVPKSAPAPQPAAAFYDDDASIGRLDTDAIRCSAPPLRPLADPDPSEASEPVRKNPPGKRSGGEIWDDMSNLG